MDPNFSLNLSDGAMAAKKLSITAPDFSLSEAGVITSGDTTDMSLSIDDGSISFKNQGQEYSKIWGGSYGGSSGILILESTTFLTIKCGQAEIRFAENGGAITIDAPDIYFGKALVPGLTQDITVRLSDGIFNR